MSLCQVRQPRHDRWSDCLLPLSDFLAPQRIQPHSPECHCDRPLFPVHFSPVLPAADLGRHLAATMPLTARARSRENATNVQILSNDLQWIGGNAIVLSNSVRNTTVTGNLFRCENPSIVSFFSGFSAVFLFICFPFVFP